jgi:hypothetical protein
METCDFKKFKNINEKTIWEWTRLAVDVNAGEPVH